MVSTYQFREKVDGYSRRVPMDEIEKNDYNLNISRYVSTARAEEEIDLKAVHATLLEIEKKTAKAAEKHNQFLRELGLSPISS
jgi:type I restriction enzyme M protein